MLLHLYINRGVIGDTSPNNSRSEARGGVPRAEYLLVGQVQFS